MIHKKTISKLFANVYCDVTSYEILWSMSVREYCTKCQYEWFTPLRALLCCIKLHRGTLIFKIYFNSKFNIIRFTRPYYCYFNYNKFPLPKNIFDWYQEHGLKEVFLYFILFCNLYDLQGVRCKTAWGALAFFIKDKKENRVRVVYNT